MKPLSLLAVACATLVLFLCTSFRPVSSHNTRHHSPKQNTHYYFYLNGGTTYDGWYSVADETDRLETMYGVYVDTNPFGGTQLAAGYVLKGYPHFIYASVILYGHY